MKLVFLSNYYTHHQAQICKSWYRLTKKEFCFVATEPFSLERIQLGWEIESQPFVLQYEVASTSLVVPLMNKSDVVILGSAPLNLVEACLKKRKIVFKYSERVFKRGYNWRKWFPRVIRYWYFYGRHKSLYLLCASAYTYGDYARHFTFIGKSYKWGYFPETKRYCDIDDVINKKKKKTLLWVGRFLDWKHPDDAIRLAKRLKDDGLNFELNMIGTGEMESQLKNMIREHALEDCVHMLGAMKPEQVREAMEKAEIFLFTSDRNEGWGAVLNESMNSACAVVASHAIGSVPFLIKDGENGLVYESGNTEMLYKKVRFLLDNPETQRKLGKQAYQTIATEWNAEVAAKRLIELSKHILQGEKHPNLYESGPCSRAKIIKDNWFVED